MKLDSSYHLALYLSIPYLIVMDINVAKIDLDSLGLRRGGAFSDDSDIEDDPEIINAGMLTRDLCKHCTRGSDACICEADRDYPLPQAIHSSPKVSIIETSLIKKEIKHLSSSVGRDFVSNRHMLSPDTDSGDEEPGARETPPTTPSNNDSRPAPREPAHFQQPVVVEYISLLGKSLEKGKSPRMELIKIKKLGLESPLISVLTFWQNHVPVIDKLIEDGTSAIITEFLSILIGSSNKASCYLRGIAGGLAMKASTRYEDMLTNIASTAETMKLLLQDSITASTAHMAQTKEFANQMTSSSKTVADFKTAVEAVKLLGVKMDVAPPGTPVHVPPIFPSSSSPPELLRPHHQAAEFTVPRLKGNGHYISKHGTVLVSEGITGTIGFTSKGLTALSDLLGLPSNVAEFVLNKDLDMLDAYGGQNPDWLRGFKAGDQKVRLRAMEILAKVPNKDNQWLKRSVI